MAEGGQFHLAGGGQFEWIFQYYEKLGKCGIILPDLADFTNNEARKKFLSSVVSFWNKIQFAISSGTTIVFAYEMSKYWNYTSTKSFCKIDGNVTNTCSIPVLSTSAVSSITESSATSGGTITDAGGSLITSRGVCWNTTSLPTISNSVTIDGTGTGNFTSNLSGLASNTNYHVRAYAANSLGIAYGNEVSFTTDATPVLSIGQSYEGGIIFYLDNTGQHGLVCSANDIGSYPWDLTIFDPQNWQDYNPPLIGSSATALGTGNTNTGQIVNSLGTGNYAASKCRTYNGGGNADWYLPSKDELNLIYINLKVPGLASFTPSYYWSSSEIDNKAVWMQKFDDGAQFNLGWKNNLTNTRPIRSF